METTLSRNPVIVVGGGLSGLAAAVRLSASRLPVLLLEQRPTLGGRASSFTDATTGDEVDNGQHLLIAGYSRTLAFVETIGARHLLQVQARPVLTFFHPRKGFVKFSLRRLPPPLNLAWGILTSPLFAPAERYHVLRAGAEIRRSGGTGMRSGAGRTIAEWLDELHQPESVRASFWIPLAVSIMNDRIETAPAATFLHALRIAFLGHWHNAALVFPVAGLSRIFAQPAEQMIVSRGGVVSCNADVRELVMHRESIRSVLLRDGREMLCRSVILAVPQGRAVELYPSAVPRPVGLEPGLPVAFSPIVSIHLWFADPFMDLECVGVIGKTIHWVFRRKTHISVVISAAHDVVETSQEDLLRVVVRELREVFGSRVGTPYHALVIRERRATTSLTPANEQRRPGTETAVKNLYLAGDWTNTGLPATIEGAIRSGESAADMVLRGE